MPRLFRESPLNGIWEGSGNVIALDVLRALSRDPESFEAFDAELARSDGADRRLDAHVHMTRELIRELARDDAREARARELVTALALALQGALLVRTAPAPVADAFIGSRLGGDGHLYGILPPGTDAASIAARA